MLPRKNRVSKKDFPPPHKQGLRVFLQLFSVVVYKNDTCPRVAVVVSKKTAKTAIMRNRIRRRVYSATSSFYTNFAFSATIVFYPKKEVSTVLFSVLKTEIETAFKKAKLL
ncbi:MAG: ribonuclease P protein component [Candidatus Yonathbacteria bacterium]|nr:ribonuclease P protein component [Candidatus Yonathbacteria bacterium]